METLKTVCRCLPLSVIVTGSGGEIHNEHWQPHFSYEVFIID